MVLVSDLERSAAIGDLSQKSDEERASRRFPCTSQVCVRVVVCRAVSIFIVFVDCFCSPGRCVR